jgi:hypothetical protein
MFLKSIAEQFNHNLFIPIVNGAAAIDSPLPRNSRNLSIATPFYWGIGHPK